MKIIANGISAISTKFHVRYFEGIWIEPNIPLTLQSERSRRLNMKGIEYHNTQNITTRIRDRDTWRISLTQLSYHVEDTKGRKGIYNFQEMYGEEGEILFYISRETCIVLIR